MRVSNLVPSTDPQHPDDSPYILSYFALRKAVGWIAITLPILVVSVVCIRHHGCHLDSISAYYYTGMRNYFVGALCAIGLFLIACLGYEEDRIPSVLAGCLAFVVAFCPTRPPHRLCSPTESSMPFPQSWIVHGIAATLLFLTLSYFCLVLFRKTAPGYALTRNKIKRNRIYAGCGVGMLAFMALYGIAGAYHLLRHTPDVYPHSLLLVVETACLLLFGIAWITKGQQIFPD